MTDVPTSDQTMARAARFSPCSAYRYTLTRIWDASLPTVNFVGLNPSTADASRDDPTIRRCARFARSWGYGGMVVTNLFALRSTDPRGLRRTDEPVGRDNDRWLTRCATDAELVVACWGAYRFGRGRSESVKAALSRKTALYCIRLNRDGSPAHPLYLPAELVPQPWQGPERS